MKVNVFILKISMIIILFGLVSCSDGSDDSDSSEGPTETKIFLGDIILNTQEEVNVFGAENYTRITGNIDIGLPNNQSNISDLSPLSSLTSVGGDFNMGWLTSLPNLNGLQNLERIEGSQAVIQASIIVNLNGLTSLNYVANRFSIFGSSIESLNGLSNLTTIGNLEIRNSKIENLNGLTNLISLEGIFLGGNINLINFSGLSNITNLNFLTSSGNPNLIDLSGLENLTDVERIVLTGNANFKNLNGLDNLTTRLTLIYIESNPLLDDFCNLEYVFVNYGFPDSYVVFDNAYNPTQQDIIDGNCSL